MDKSYLCERLSDIILSQLHSLYFNTNSFSRSTHNSVTESEGRVPLNSPAWNTYKIFSLDSMIQKAFWNGVWCRKGNGQLKNNIKVTKRCIKSKNEINAEKEKQFLIWFTRYTKSLCMVNHGLKLAASHRTDLKTENDQNKPQNDTKETFLWIFSAVWVIQGFNLIYL